MRALTALALAVALTACSVQTPAADTPAFPESGEQKVELSVNDDLPQWLLIARQAGGGAIFWDRTSLVRNAEGQASVWARVEFDTNQVRNSQEGDTIQAVTYRISDVHYQFTCADSTFVILEQRYVDGDGRIAGQVTIENDPPTVALPGTVGGLLLPIACAAR
jgi:hypothetical protein